MGRDRGLHCPRRHSDKPQGWDREAGRVMLQTQCWKIVVILLLLAGTKALGQRNDQIPSESPLAALANEDGSKGSAAELIALLDTSAPAHIDFLPLLSSPAATFATPAKPAVRKPHATFFDRENNFLIGASAITIALDGLSTQRFLANPNSHEMNPIAKPFVYSRAGSAAYFGVSFVGELALMRIAHKRNHHLLERIIPMLVTGSESYVLYNNYSLSRR
jgi:hypothetical protein